ncbi:helix-turn-helix transcriptional regulator [Macrococcoides bohemicum]|nr:helix-turn-helix transcriptional regulator [Macrococcus bohemicus]
MNQLIQLRKQRGLTQSDVAEGIGLATTTIAGTR